jgi:DNA adenine methylase
MAASVPHPIPYQGSKRSLAPVILNYFPANASRLIELFAGSAAVALAALHTRRVDSVVLNDINRPLIDLWQTIIEQPEILAEQYARLWHEQSGREREFYDEVRQRFNSVHQPEDFLYLLARCVKASVRYNRSGEFNQSPDNRRRGRHPSAMKHDILTASRLLKGRTQLMFLDFREVLGHANPQDILYLDPPYQGVSTKRDPRYMEAVSYETLVETLFVMNDKNLSFIVSYDGKTGEKAYGQHLPTTLNLRQIEIDAGISAQATLLGRRERTVEFLYLSPALAWRLEDQAHAHEKQLSLFEALP